MTSIRETLRRIPPLPAIILIATSLVIFIVLNPGLIFSATTPTGGDTGAHVFGPAYLRDTLLPAGKVLGWSNDWFAGFPVFYFYFPLPSLVIVALDFFIPYGVAFKIVTVLGLLAMAPAIYFHARALNLGRHISLITAGSGAVFVFYESFSIYGGNVASTLAGEFSYSWSFALSLVYLGLLIKAVREDRKYVKWAALALALTALSHVLTTIVIIFASLFVLAARNGPARTFLVWFWGFAIAAFWALPLIARIGLTSDMAWTPLSRWEEIFPVELWVLVPVAIPAAVWAVRKTKRVVPLLAATLLPVIYYPLPGLLPELLPDVFGGERWKLWNGRLLPYWYFGVAFFAALGLGVAVMWLSRRLPSRVHSHWPRAFIAVVFAVATGLVIDSVEFADWAWILVVAGGLIALAATYLLETTVNSRNFLTFTAASVVVLGAAAGVTFIDGWAKWNYEGYEAKEPWPAYEALMLELDALPEGRVQWEANSELNRYGTPMSPMLIPYWTDGSHQSMEGLYFESSLTTPFHFINHSEMSYQPSNPIPGLRYHTFDMERGLAHMDLYGVGYYVSFTPEAADKALTIDGFTEVSATGPFRIFELPETDLVVPATLQPAVYEVPERGLFASLIGSETVTGDDGESLPSFHDLSLEWYDDIENLHRWVVADGPEDWPRIESIADRPDEEVYVRGNDVSDIVLEPHRISFSTEAVGVPHLVKVSYFPNWTATGADGPWRASPSLMVVVPTQEDVVIEFADTWAESGGKLLSLGGVGALIAVGLLHRRRRLNSGEDGSAS
ncbi:MAG TPA: hypothetical protein VK969_05660 [Acidimicrobiia bacterium]|nr:hypothetical protein [Acidimicrobiia bacterium]